MRQLKCWLIANITSLSAILFILTYGIGCKMTGKSPSFFSDPNLNEWESAVITALIIYPFGGAFPFKNFIGDLGNFVFLCFGAFVCYMYMGTSIIMGVVISVIFGIMCAIYTSANFYEVVSVRMIYASSNTALFESNVLYTFNRFIACTHAVMYELILLTYFVI